MNASDNTNTVDGTNARREQDALRDQWEIDTSVMPKDYLAQLLGISRALAEVPRRFERTA